MPSLTTPRAAAPTSPSARVETFQAATLTECLLLARRALGPDAEILSQRKLKKKAVLGRWGGEEMMEVTCRLTQAAPASSAAGGRAHDLVPPPESQIQTLEARLAELTASVQGLVQSAQKPSFQPVPVAVQGVGDAATDPAKRDRRTRGLHAPAAPAEPYPALMQQLLDAEVAAPLARNWVGEIPMDLSDADARTELRTRMAQRLLIDARDAVPTLGRLRLLAFVGTTGVGKTTTIAKLAARHALVERCRVGIITLDTYRIAAAQQLQAYGEALRVPVRVAADRAELHTHLAEFAGTGVEIVLMDTTGRSPNEMIPLGETAHVFEGLGPVRKYLALPATLSARDMDHVVARFRHALAPDALILTKLDEATDCACFGKLLTVQAKHGLPLAYVTTGQKVPDDIAVPDAHAIAARIVSSALF